MRVVATFFFVALASLALATPVRAQGGTTSTISGVVVDSAGGVVPGASVVIKHNATAVTQSGVSNPQGVFSFPGLNTGTYTVTVTLQGFKSFVANDVVITSGAPANVRALLEVGGLEETVTVSSTAEVVQTQSTTIATTITTNQITKLPLTSRSAMDFVTYLPGVTTPGGNRQSTVNGLPQGLINITLDGVNIQDNTLRSTDGFFAIVSPRLDAVEEVTVTTATQGAESAQGAVQIKFVTRSGGNQFTGSAYEYYRRDRLNSNTWFNERDHVAIAKLKQDQFGGRVGGPIVIPGLFDGHNKAFFFFNYEEIRQPSDVTRNRTVLNTDAQKGIYAYKGAGGVIQKVNLFTLPGQTATADPLITKLLGDIRNAVSGGSLTDVDPNLQRFTYNVPVQSKRQFPTFRIDYNLTSRHRLTSAFNYQLYTDFPDTLNGRDAQFPGFPVAAGQSSERLGFSNSVRSTLSSSLVNEARLGYSGAPVSFFKELNTGMFGGTSVADQGGFRLSFPDVGNSLTNPAASPSPQSRNATALVVEDTLSWLKGSHSISMGGSFTQYTFWQKMSALVPSISFGMVTGDPAESMFSDANFPGAAATNFTAAKSLYALLTGRVSQIGGDARIDETTGQYSYMGVGMERARMRESGFHIQDSWRVRPNFTLNFGARYDLQMPFYPLNSSYTWGTMADLCGVSGVNAQADGCNLFQPGVLTDKHPEFAQYVKGTKGYNVDYNNIAPNVGLAWTTGGKTGLLRTLIGQQGDSVVRAGYSRAYTRSGMNDFTGFLSGNPGVRIVVNRNASLGNLGANPLLLRNSSQLGPADFTATPQYPLHDVVTGDINVFDPNTKVPYADTYTVGLQRAVGRTMAVEVRYIGSRSTGNWQTLNYNELDIYENGFLNEFRLAQANLQANNAAGGKRAASFAYFGPGTGTNPLPIMLANFAGLGGDASKTAANYTSKSVAAAFANTTYLSRLAMYNPNPFGLANDLISNATFRSNATKAGEPANFFVANPDLLGGANLRTNLGSTRFNGLQLEFRRRFTGGLQFGTSYAYGKGYRSQWETFRRPQFNLRSVGSGGGLTHAFKANVVYDLPFGRGGRFGSGASGILDRFIGGWTIGLNSRIQSGQLVDLGNVRLVGMSAKDVAAMYQIRIDKDKKVWLLPQDVIDNTIKAFSVSATSTTGYGTLGPPSGRYFAPANGPDCIEPDNGANYGDCGIRSLVVPGPVFKQTDISIAKRIAITGRTNLELRLESLNAFNNVNFVPRGGIGNQISSYEITGLTGTDTARVTQLVVRFNW